MEEIKHSMKECPKRAKLVKEITARQEELEAKEKAEREQTQRKRK